MTDSVTDLLAAVLGAREVTRAELAAAGRCCTCAGPCTPVRPGVPTVCIRCVAAELGTSVYVLRLASEHRLSIAACEARLERHGPPHVSPREWLTPRSRWRK